MLPNQIVHLLLLFDIFGYCTGSTALTKYKKIQSSIFTLHVTLVMLFTLYQIEIFLELNAMIGLLETLNELLQYKVGLFTYWLIILDSYLHRRKHRCLWETVQRIDSNFCTQQMFFRNFIYRLIEFFPVSNILFFVMFSIGITPQTRSVFIYNALIMICQFRMFYYIFCLEMINWQLKMIEKEISTNPINDFSSIITQFRFKWIKGYYDCVIVLTENFSEIFGLSQLASILFAFYSLSTDLNWLYANANRFSVTQMICKFINNTQIFMISILIKIITTQIKMFRFCNLDSTYSTGHRLSLS